MICWHFSVLFCSFLKCCIPLGHFSYYLVFLGTLYYFLVMFDTFGTFPESMPQKSLLEWQHICTDDHGGGDGGGGQREKEGMRESSSDVNPGGEGGGGGDGEGMEGEQDETDKESIKSVQATQR